MSLKITVALLSMVAATFYIIGSIGTPFLFVVVFPIISLSFLGALFFAIFLLVRDPISKLLPPNMRRMYEKHELRHRVLIFVCLVFLFLGGWAINRYLLPHKFHPISLLGDTGILVFTIFLGWNLAKPDRKGTLVAGTAAFILFISILTVVGSISITPAQIKPSSTSTEALRSLPYLTWVAAEKSIEKSGVTKWDQERTFTGINIYNPRNLATAYLIDMSGNVLHTWSAGKRQRGGWQHIEMCKNGDLLAIVNDRELMRLDWDSNIKWIRKMRFHHDIAIAGNGDIYALARKDELAFIFGLPVPVRTDYIVVLSPDGAIKKELSLFKVLRREIPFNRVPSIYRWIFSLENRRDIVLQKAAHNAIFRESTPPDIFHNNTVEIIDRDIDGLCKRGNILISVRELDLIGIVDAEKEELIWSWGPGNVSKQHHPTLLENGNILIFDNIVLRKKHSRVVELDPLRKKIVWEYRANPPEQFYSSGRGSSQRLPNGNTLVTESNSGRVFEITRGGDTVWEFYNPEVNIKAKKRTAIYRMMRIMNPEDFPFLRTLK